MNIFLSYPSSHRHIAENVCYALQAEGHEVFFDKEDLPPGQGYNALIRNAIENCNLFIFMITPESVAQGKYTLTELKIVIRKWPNPTGHVLPVMLEATQFDEIPAYLKAGVTILLPEGNLAAEIAMEVAGFDNTEVITQNTSKVETEFSVFSYLPLEIRFGSGEEGQYPIAVKNSPVGVMQAQPCLFDSLALEQLLQEPTGHINETLRLVQNNQNIAAGIILPPLADAKIIGEQLYQLLFSSPIQSYLNNSLKLINSQQGQGLRFLINTTETPHLAKLPWEFLYSPKQDDFLFTDVMKPVVRWLDVDQPVPSLVVKSPLRLLIAIASPANRPELSIGTEISHLDESLRDLVDKGLVEIQRLDHTTLEQLDSALLHYKPHVLHFIGHGDFSENEGMIILETQSSGADPISGRRLSVLLRNHLGSLRFVFLNSCLGATISEQDPFGGVAQSLIQRGVPAVIAMQFPIPDLAAVSLARHFYRYLAAGLPVDAAITSTRAFMFAKGYEVEWGAPALYMRTPDGRLFDIDRVDAWKDSEPFIPDTEFFEPDVDSVDNLPMSSKGKWWLVPLVLVCLAVVGYEIWQFSIKDTEKDTENQATSIENPAELSPVKIAERIYRTALVNLKEGRTKVALEFLRVAKLNDFNFVWLSNNLEFRSELIKFLTNQVDLELANGNIKLAQNIADHLRAINPILSQQVEPQILKAEQQVVLVNSLNEQITQALNKDDWLEAQKKLDQLIKIAPENSQIMALKTKITQLEINKKVTPKPQQVHKVIKGDTLWTIAESTYGDPTLWPRIYAANRGEIINPNIISLDQQLILPKLSNVPSVSQSQRVIKKGDSLWRIAGNVYGDPNRWPEIYKVNRHLIQTPDLIYPNQVLNIPTDLKADTHE